MYIPPKQVHACKITFIMVKSYFVERVGMCTVYFHSMTGEASLWISPLSCSYQYLSSGWGGAYFSPSTLSYENYVSLDLSKLLNVNKGLSKKGIKQGLLLEGYRVKSLSSAKGSWSQIHVGQIILMEK